MPDESTIRKLTRRCGAELIEALNRELLAAADGRGEVDVERVRVDTTVVEADIRYPTDSGLLTAATCRIASRLRRLRTAGVKVTFIGRTSEASALQHSIGVWLRRRSDGARQRGRSSDGHRCRRADRGVARDGGSHRRRDGGGVDRPWPTADAWVGRSGRRIVRQRRRAGAARTIAHPC